jgi:hypothetical protein
MNPNGFTEGAALFNTGVALLTIILGLFWVLFPILIWGQLRRIGKTLELIQRDASEQTILLRQLGGRLDTTASR